MGFTFSTILLATLAATMVPNPSHAVLTDVGLDKMVDINEIEVTVDYQTTHKTFGVAEAAWFEKAIVEAINDVYSEDELHAYGAKVTHSSRRPATLSEVLQGKQDLAMLDDVVELAEEALALEALIMDNEGVTIDKVRSEMSYLRRKTWAGTALLNIQTHCRLCANDDDNVGDWLESISRPSKRSEVGTILGSFLRKEGFGIAKVKVDIKYHGREFDPADMVEEDISEKGVFEPVFEGPVLVGALAAN
jgi:hypothetical protein